VNGPGSGRGRLSARLCSVVAVVAGVLVAPTGGSLADAAPLPNGWCGTAGSTTDLPDAVAGAQIHVLYAHAADVPDQTAFWAPQIANDLAGIDSWWQGQDPTRTPRFDLAAFPSCDSTFGQLDITTVSLSRPATDYDLADAASLAAQVRTEILSIVGDHRGKNYLVYLDLPVAFVGRSFCGWARPGSAEPSGGDGVAFVFLQPNSSGCTVGGGFGTGNGWPARTAAHELAHLLAFDLAGAPHACAGETIHICDSDQDILWGGSASISTLSEAVLDVGHDDYYGHSLPDHWNARNSPWLTHLDAPRYAVSVSIAPRSAGQVASAWPGISCPTSCGLPWDAGTIVELTATPALGYAFSHWTGDCDGGVHLCSLTSDSPKRVTANFARVGLVEVRVKGNGLVLNGGSTCRRRCGWPVALHSNLELVALPAPGASFVGWSGACHGTRKQCTTKMRQHLTVTARFEERKQSAAR
jgi:hypothetical protein